MASPGPYRAVFSWFFLLSDLYGTRIFHRLKDNPLCQLDNKYNTLDSLAGENGNRYKAVPRSKLARISAVYLS